VANLLVREGRVEEALEAYERLAEEGWNSVEVQYRRGVALSRQGDEDGAIQAYQRATQADANHVLALKQLALVYAGRQRYDEAAVLLQRAAELAPNDVQVHYNLGNMQARQAIEAGELMNYGYADAALHAYRRAIELDPQCLKAYYNLACVAEKMSPQEGITAWEQYIAASSAVPAEQEWMVKARGYLRSLKAP
jgi:tetratricopeptide (TPR) repeat protein